MRVSVVYLNRVDTAARQMMRANAAEQQKARLMLRTACSYNSYIFITDIKIGLKTALLLVACVSIAY